jgi:hypothetical protein
VIITDKDNQLRTAIESVWPTTQLQLCVFHINSNVVLKIKQKWVKPVNHALDEDEEEEPVEDKMADLAALQRANVRVKDMKNTSLGPLPRIVCKNRAGFYLLWQHVVYSKSEEDFGKAWVRLQKDFQDQQPLLRYLREEWLPLKKQWACCYTRFYHNFGFITRYPDVDSKLHPCFPRTGA